MGWFLNVAAAILERESETFIQSTQTYRFDEAVYISWRQPLTRIKPPEGWQSLAEGTLHVQVEQPVRWANTTIFPVVENINRQAHRYNHVMRLAEPGGLFHLVLPPYFLLRLEGAEPFPTYALPHGDRLAIGWICPAVTRFSFIFEETSQGFHFEAPSLERSVERGQAEAIEMERELGNIEDLLQMQQGNLRHLELQAARYGIDIPLHLHHELQHVKEQIDRLQAKRMQLLNERSSSNE